MNKIDFIKYEPPYGGQAFKKRGIKLGYEMFIIFLNKLTNKKNIDSMDLTIFEENKYKNDDNYESSAYVNQAIQLFGLSEKKLWCSNIDNNQKENEYSYTWSIKDDDFMKCINFAENQKPFPKYWIGPIQISISVDFTWKLYNIPKEQIIVDYFSNNHTILTLSKTNSIIMDFIFPFKTLNNKFYNLYNQIIADLPVNLSINKFRHYIPNKQNTDYKVRKLSKELINDFSNNITFS